MSIAQGTGKQIRVARQSAKGTIASAGGGYILRRTQAMYDLKKDAFTTEEEITSIRQLRSNRHGARRMDGKHSGILSAGTYSDVLSALLMRDLTAVSAITTLSITVDLGSVVGGVQTYTVERATGSWLTDGIKVGFAPRLTAGSLNAANLNKSLLVLSVEALTLTVIPVNGVALVAEGPIASCTLTVPGKVTYAPNASQTNIYYTVETWFPDVPTSERNTDVKFVQADLKFPGTGNCMIDLTAIGLDQSSDASVYFTSPTAETSTGAVTAPGGLMVINGVPQAILTDLSFSLNGNGNPADPVLGTNVRPDVFTGKIMVTGQFTAYFDSQTLPDMFRDESTVGLVAVATDAQTGTANFFSVSLPSIKINDNTQDDNETGLKRTYSFTAEYYASGGAAVQHNATSIQIHDSAAA